MSKPSKNKTEKKLKRDKANRKRRNVEHNSAPVTWRLDVLLDGEWYTAKKFRRTEQVEAHIADTEARRKAGETIVRGKIIHVSTGTTIREIEASGSTKGPLDAKSEGVSKEEPAIEEFDKNAAKRQIEAD